MSCVQDLSVPALIQPDLFGHRSWERVRHDPRPGSDDCKPCGGSLVLDDHIEAIRAVLTDDLLKPEFRRMRTDGDDPAKGHCYAASEALFHLCGGRACGLAVCHGKDEDGITHWWLRSSDGTIYDPTASQYLSTGRKPPYQAGRGGGFLTSMPSKRAREIMARVAERGRQLDMPGEVA